MDKVWLDLVNIQRWYNYKQTDFQYELWGGLTASNGDMSCQIIIKQPKSDKRYKIGKRYVEFDRIPCIKKTECSYGLPSTISSERYMEITI